MGRRRGFFAELQHQQRLAEQRQRREQAAAVRSYNAAVRASEQARRNSERAAAATARAAASQLAAAQREARATHKAEMTAEADRRTADLTRIYDAIDTILEATLAVDDYVDLAALRTDAVHPAFSPGSVATPTPPPAIQQPPPEPVFAPIPDLRGPAKLFGRARHEQEVASALSERQRLYDQWKYAATVSIPEANRRAVAIYERREAERLEQLAELRATYDAECVQRDADAKEQAKALNRLIRGLAYAEPDAVDEYVGIVLASSVYPDEFKVIHDFTFNGELRELTLCATVPPPSDIPSTKQVKYVASADELRASDLAQAAQRARYNSAVYAVALRSIHEVFEADRQEVIDYISLSVKTETRNPATGHDESLTLVETAVSRSTFLDLDLANVDPLAALKGLASSVSKNPFALVPVPAAGTAVRR